ncbi:MAG: MaoC family dehydratase [Rhizobiaceae bacterium]|nr:MaoC family dehydratase [Rhizobiaceae bacterium]|tara:strand:- start:59548 stop:60033 length:486 start_codon:yes stop_codon:yes gene_type:complete
MPRTISLSELSGLVGTELGVSDWIEVDQSMIDQFADATHDHQFIHVDVARAKAETPFKGTIAHGFLTLSLLSAMNYSAVPQIRERRMGINYGFDKVRLITPVKSGARVRGRFILKATRLRGADMMMLTFDVTVEIDGQKNPALTAEWLTIAQFDPKDRPDA